MISRSLTVIDIQYATYSGDNDFKVFKNTFLLDAEAFGWSHLQQAWTIRLYLSGKALKTYESLDSSDQKDFDKIFEALKKACSKSPQYYLNMFFNRKLNQGETIASFCTAIQEYLDDALPKVDEYTRDQLLISRLISNVPENVKNFLELMSDKLWKEPVIIFDKSMDNKKLVAQRFDLSEVNKIDYQSRSQFQQQRSVVFATIVESTDIKNVIVDQNNNHRITCLNRQIIKETDLIRITTTIEISNM